MQNKLLLMVLIASFCILTCNVIAKGDTGSTNNFVNGNTTAHTYIVKGIVAYELGNYEEAIKCYDNAIALEPGKEMAEAGWAGKELAFYKQGKSYEALCCDLKLKSIDQNTKLIEKSKDKLLNSALGSTRVSLFWGFIDTEGLLIGLHEAGGVLLAEGFTSSAASGAGTIAALSNPMVIAGAVLIIGVIAYENRQEIKNYINSTL